MKTFIFSFLTVIVIFTNVSLAFATEASLIKQLTQKAADIKLYRDTEWIRLGHYINDNEYGWISEVDGETFFLSPKGKMNPHIELEASIQKIFNANTTLDDNHPRCKFPARYEYLTRKLGLDFNLLSEDKCIEFNKFKNRLDTESISLVFSSYYMNNPSSTFGHTLLRMNKKRDPNLPSTELLDFGINFAANPWTDNPLLYAIGGIVGWFPGTFSNIPYHLKVREYNDHESRDLWSYKLNVTTNEIRQLERHLWELGDTYFKYYFFSENCSYHLLRAIEAAAPRLDLTKDLPHWVIPSDTVLTTYNIPGLVAEVSYRPSNLRQFLARYDSLSKIEQNIFHQKINQKYKVDTTFENLPQESSARILDTVIDYYEFKNANHLLNPKSEESKFKQRLLLSRAQNPVISPALKVQEPKAKPHEGHPSLRVGVEAGYSERLTDFQTFHLRFALHDILDPDYGYPENTQIEFMNINFKAYNEFKSHRIDQLTFVGVKSLSPRTFYSPHLSWSMDFGLKTFYDKQCEMCTGGYFQNAWGFSYQFLDKTPLTLFVLGEYELNYSDSLIDDNFRVLVGPRVGALYKIRDHFKILADTVYYYDPLQDYDFYQINISANYALSKFYSLRLNAKSRNDDLESSLALYWYF